MLRLATLVLLVLAAVPAATAATPVAPQTLVPSPPPYETCNTTGSGTICQGTQTVTYGPIDTGIVCGSGAAAFDIYDSGTESSLARRIYDTNGMLVTRMRYVRLSDSRFTNVVTGATVPYIQTNTLVDDLAVRGDLSSATETMTGQNIYRPSTGAPVFLNAGRTIFGPGGALEFSAGPQAFLSFFVDGNASVLLPLCAALGA